MMAVYLGDNAITREALRVLENRSEPVRADVLYGSAPGIGTFVRQYYPPRIPTTFPRTESQRIARMNRYVEWKRQKITERREREWLAAGVAMIATPIVIAIVSWLWRWAIVSVLG